MFNQLSTALFFTLLAAGVVACQTDIYARGKGPIVISPRILAGFEKYKLHDNPSYFAVANDGKGYGFTHCLHPSCVDDTGQRARELCERKAKTRGTTCSVFAIGREVVWDGPVSYSKSDDDYLFLFAKVSGGSSTNYHGAGNTIENGRKIALRVGQCIGEADLNTKEWYIKECKNNYSATGTFVAGTGSEKFYGVGRDHKGNSVEIKVLVPNFSEKDFSSTESTLVTKENSQSTSDEDSYALSLQWEGIEDLLAGFIHYPKPRNGTFTARLSGEGWDCSGSYTFSGDRTTGVWNIACANQRAASGTFIMNENGSSGTGVDPKGRRVRYTVSRR